MDLQNVRWNRFGGVEAGMQRIGSYISPSRVSILILGTEAASDSFLFNAEASHAAIMA